MDIVPCKADSNQLIVEEDSKKELNRNEYPILWYEPDIDSEEKKTFKALIQEKCEIHLFPKFEEAFGIAQSLGSFLLITPVEIDEEKLFQDFKALEDTHGRRYFDFEEEAVLRSLFKEISEEKIKSLKVYVFCTREDFLKEAPISEEEEEVVLKCDIKEMAKHFQEEFKIIWCDPDSSPESKEDLVNQLDIEEENIYPSFDDLLKRLDNYSGLPYHLILSGKTKTEFIINRIEDLKDLLCLYIYDSSLAADGKKARKIKMEKTLEELIPRIIEGVRTNLKYKNTFPAFATQFDDWDKSHINKVHYYLKGFINFHNRRQAKGDFISLAKRIYQSKKLLSFEKEYSAYDKKKILEWYAAETPIYKLINNCLRIATSDSITYCRFVLKDLETAIREDFQQQSNKYSGIVYRGAYISKDEFEKLERNVGKEIEMYGFLSTSMRLQAAENFMNNDMKNKVFITIIIPPLPSPKLDEQGFVEMKTFSPFSEEEILFNVRSRFEVLEVGNIELGKNKKECRHLVLLYGAQLLRRYMTIENPRVSLEFELPLEFQCNYCESKNDLFASIVEKEKTEMICRECFYPNIFASNTTFLLPIDKNVEFDKERRIKREVSGKMLEFGMEAKLTCVKTYKCSQCLKFCKGCFKSINLEDESLILDCEECFKNTQGRKVNRLLLFEGQTQVFWSNKQRKWEEIDMDWKAGKFKNYGGDFGTNIFERTHENRQCQEFCRRVLQNSVRKMTRETVKVVSYWQLGKSSENLGEHKKALEYHQRGLEMRKFIFGESHQDIAISYNNLASVYKSLGKHQKALEYHQKALEIRKFIYGESHPDTATSYNNLALVYESLGEYQEGLEYQLKALEIRKSFYGESHPDIATSYNNLASVNNSLGKHQEALEYQLKALEIKASIYGESHPEIAISYNNLASVSNSLGKHQEALEYHQKALEILQSIFGKSHPHIATSYNNLALVYESLGEYQKALEYHLKALEIRKSFYGESHPDIATSYNNLALVYESLGKHQKALEYHQKALEIQKSIYGESHSDIATSYNNLGLVYKSLGEHQKALEYHQKALEIQTSIYGESHPHIATSYSKLGLVYGSLGEYQKALEYQLKAFEIRKSVYGESHPDIGISYDNLATTYYSLGEHQKALAYQLKALEILKSFYGESHPQIATSYVNLALMYVSLGEHQKALEYQLKALEIRKSFYGESHPVIATSYNNLASVYKSLGKHQEALEYYLKSLEIRKSFYGESHPDIATSYNNLASVYNSLGKHQEALEYHQKALEIQTSIHGESHPHIATSYNNLASVYSSLGKHQEALEYHQKTLEILQSIFGKSHPHIATSYNNLALVYESLGEYQKALEYHLKALEIRKSIYGESHSLTATSYNNLALVYEGLGKHQEALEYQLKALEVGKSISGKAKA